jgi:FKBP-type peptidyl-prolyl cis-trans isomerase
MRTGNVLMAAAAAALAGLALLWLPGRPLAADAPEAAKPEFEKLAEKAGYSVGLQIGRNFRRVHAEFDQAAFVRGFEDGIKGRPALIADEEMEKAKQEFVQTVEKELPARNLKDGEAFLAGNRGKPGVTETKSGLQYAVLTAAKDPKAASPKATDRVKVNYRGTLPDGTEFDSSYRRGQPVTFNLDRVVPGWTEGVQLMKVGEKYRFWVPAKLGYGERGTGQDGPIGPNQALVFEVELLGIEQ